MIECLFFFNSPCILILLIFLLVVTLYFTNYLFPLPLYLIMNLYTPSLVYLYTYTMYLILPSPFYLLPSTESSGSIVINFGNSNFNFFSSSSQNAFQTFRSIFGFVSVVSVCSQFLVTAFPPTVFIRLG
uniref:Uncharacterized protein n=1 Tax=Cacopsylla melanoneura TaxID=428564 RepID=A0A8D8QXL1_9HEMI